MKYCSSPNEIPAAPHFAILLFEKVHAGEETTETIKYISFSDEEDLRHWMEINHNKNSVYKIIQSFPKFPKTKLMLELT